MPLLCGSTSPITALAAIAASIALPPRSRIWTPACAASGWLAATMPYFVATFDRPATIVGFAGGCRAGTAMASETSIASDSRNLMTRDYVAAVPNSIAVHSAG